MADDLEDLGLDAGRDRAPRQVVIVQYRRSLASRLTTPILVMIAALAVLSHVVKLDNWRGLFGTFAEPRPLADEPAAPRPAVTLAAPSPLMRTPVAAARSTPPASPPRPLALRPLNSLAAHAVIDIPQPGAETADAWEDIRRESEQSKSEAREMEALKAKAAAESPRFAAAHRAAMAALEAAESLESREEFREALRRALEQPDGRSAQVVEELCRQHGVRLAADKLPPGTATLPILSGSAGIRYRVKLLRAKGVAEVAILDDLARNESKNYAARSGPRLRSEVIVRAARQLLSVPPGTRQVDSE
jgi:hypothetical protein